MAYGTLVINLIYAGHLDNEKDLAAIGLTDSLCIAMVIAPMLGINAAVETLTSQAYGSEDKHLCGVYLNRGTLILLTFFLILCLGPILFAEQIFIGLG